MLFVTENITTIYSADAPETTTGQTALEEIYNQADDDTAFVSRSNRFYRWFGSNTTAPDGESIVKPKGFEDSQPGRWIRQGFPGPGGNRIPSGALTASGRMHCLMRVDIVLTGGAPAESRRVTLNSSEFLFDQNSAIGIGNATRATNDLGSPGYSVVCLLRNNSFRVDVAALSGNIEAGSTLSVWILRTDDRIAQPNVTVI